MSTRRYSDAEVAEIFRRATEAQHKGGAGTRAPLASSEGMTLEALQDIGKEVGIPAELIVREARAIERAGQPTTSHFAGIPIGVGRTVGLSRKLSESEWEQLVVQLRDTFDARGKLLHEGTFKGWKNGNLQILLEPAGDAHRLRMKTRDGRAQAWLTASMAVTGVGVVTLLAALTGDVPRDDMWSKFAPMLAMGAGFFIIGVARLRGWLRERRRQFEEIAATVVSTTEGPPRGSGS